MSSSKVTSLCLRHGITRQQQAIRDVGHLAYSPQRGHKVLAPLALHKVLHHAGGRRFRQPHGLHSRAPVQPLVERTTAVFGAQLRRRALLQGRRQRALPRRCPHSGQSQPAAGIILLCPVSCCSNRHKESSTQPPESGSPCMLACTSTYTAAKSGGSMLMSPAKR